MQKLLFLFGIISLLISSCKKPEGCTSATALNYDEEAKKDDGSCVYPEDLPDSADVYFFYTGTDTLMFLGDTLNPATSCPSDADITSLGYHYKMKNDKDYFDGEYDGEKFFSFSNFDGDVFNFYGHMQLNSDGDSEFQIGEIQEVSAGINESFSANCITDSYTKEVVIISF